MLDLFPVNVKDALLALQHQHGSAAMDRINRYLSGTQADRALRNPLQRGKHILPGLSAKPWHNVEDYPSLQPLVRALEGHHGVIKNEFITRVAAADALVYYGLGKQNQGWKALYLYENGQPLLENHGYFRKTIDCLHGSIESLLYPLAEVHFSILEPGAHIPLHCDEHNFTLSFHLAVDIPEGCELRVAGEGRRWQEGKVLLFDHSFEHEARNRSSARRAVLIMDVWNPETTVVERKALGIIFKWMFDAFRGLETKAHTLALARKGSQG